MTPPKRLQSQTERDISGLQARAERLRDAVPFEAPDEITGAYEGEELREYRRLRPDEERIERLETKHDTLVEVVGELRETVGVVSGKLDVLPQLITLVQQAAQQAQQREHVTFTAKVDVDKATALDTIDARKTRRTVVARLALAAFGGGGLWELLHRLGVL